MTPQEEEQANADKRLREFYDRMRPMFELAKRAVESQKVEPDVDLDALVKSLAKDEWHVFLGCILAVFCCVLAYTAYW